MGGGGHLQTPLSCGAQSVPVSLGPLCRNALSVLGLHPSGASRLQVRRWAGWQDPKLQLREGAEEGRRFTDSILISVQRRESIPEAVFQPVLPPRKT